MKRFLLLFNYIICTSIDQEKEQYVVLMKSGMKKDDFTDHIKDIQHLMNELNPDSESLDTIESDYISGYMGFMNQKIVDQLKTNDKISCISKNTLKSISIINGQNVYNNRGEEVQKGAPWGLARISSKYRLNGTTNDYFYNKDGGKGIITYILDSGINVQHSDFEGRAIWGINLVNSIDTDENGHGTHVAGIVGGKNYGVSKQARLVAVKVLDSKGQGDDYKVLKGLDWIANHIKRNQIKESIINMSLGGPFSKCINQVIEQISQLSTVVVAAGNEGTDSCKFSPSSAKGVISVASSNVRDQLSKFSNIGTCVSLIAPGENISSDWIGSQSSIKTISGTSMAAPHVAGIISNIFSLSIKKSDIGVVLNTLKDFSLKGFIKGCENTNTPNLLLHFN